MSSGAPEWSWTVAPGGRRPGDTSGQQEAGVVAPDGIISPRSASPKPGGSRARLMGRPGKAAPPGLAQTLATCPSAQAHGGTGTRNAYTQWVEMRQGLESHLLHPELVSFHPDLLDTCGPSGWSLSNQGTSMAGSGFSSEQKIPLEVMERSGVWSEPASPDGSGRGALRSAWDE